jgi:hypothetical protein
MSSPEFEKGWEVPGHDYQARTGATQTQGPTQVVYRKGGATGKIVATETLTYDADGNVLTRGIVWAKDIFM